MIETAAVLLLVSLVLGYLGANALRIHASRSGYISVDPYSSGQRQFTPLERLAMVAIYRRTPGLSEYNFDVFSPLAPWWAWGIGLIADLVFVLAAAVFVVSIWTGVASPLKVVIAFYCTLSCVVFCYNTLWRGEIGRMGYHLRFLFTVVLWPLFFILAIAEGRDE